MLRPMSPNALVPGAYPSPTTVNSGPPGAGVGRSSARVLRLTLLLHPDGRSGDEAELPELAPGVPLALSRTGPIFRGSGAPLDHPRVSRRPLWICREGDALVIHAGGAALRVAVDGAPLEGALRLPLARLESDGVLLEFADCVLLWLQLAERREPGLPDFGLIGRSAGIEEVRRQIARVAPTGAPVMVRGESGVGKELVARAIASASPRREAPFLAVNMAALPLHTAAAELFGHGRGAFTGAVSSRSGWFDQADGGTLFLDEIGETPVDVQPTLLRALDCGEIQPLGQPPRRVDVRILSATDADLEGLVSERRFRSALLYRLASAVIHVPPLRERPVDIPLLFYHFLREALAGVGAADRLAGGEASPWLRAELLYTLMRHPFHGNVRELRSLALNVATASCGLSRAELPPEFGASRRPSASPSARVSTSPEAIAEALEQHDFNLAKTAAALGISRNTLVDAMSRIEGLHHAKDLDASTILGALDASTGSLEQAARALRVSVHGLRLRMNALSIAHRG